MEIISRSDAKARGLKHFFTGMPCELGHVDHRFVSSTQCKTCSYERSRQIYRRKHPRTDRMCCECSEPIGSNRNGNARYCSPKCRSKAGVRNRNKEKIAAYRRANRQHIREWARNHYATHQEVRDRLLADGRDRKLRKRSIRNTDLRCGVCGTHATPDVVHRSTTKMWLCSERCREQRRKEWEPKWRENNRQRLREQGAARRAKLGPDYWARYYAKHRERKKAATRAWYRANVEYATQRSKAYNARWLAENPEEYRAVKRKASNKRRALKKRVFVDAVDPLKVFERDKGRCGICRKKVTRTEKWEIDHVIPISKGGAHCYENVQLSHRKCNRTKSAKVLSGQPTLFQVLAS